jgi:hypothetical protein
VGRYLDIADSIPRRGESKDRDADHKDPTDLTELDIGSTRRLLEAGWKPKVSFGQRVIWERPDTGFWVSEEMALHLLNKHKEAGR